MCRQIFLAFALDKKNQYDDAEKVYLRATELRPKDAQAWQGLIKLYEKQGAKKLGPYQHAVVNLAHIFHEAEDMYKCQDVVDKFISFARDQGDKLQYADALWIQLPESPLYSILEGRFPAPAKVYETITLIIEDFEKKKINTLIGERRTRLGAKLSEVTLDVKREVFAQSKLEHLYRQLINWLSDDELRRTYEEKLLQYCYERLLTCAAGKEKDVERKTVLGLANDMVVIEHPFKLAWDIAIEWQDFKEIKDWDVNRLRSYCSFFPDSDLYKLITAFLTSTISPFPKLAESEKKPTDAELSDDSDDDDDEGGVPTSMVPLTEEDRIIMMTEGITGSESVLGYRLVGQYFLHIGEYETVVEFMRKALPFAKKETSRTGFVYNNTKDALSLCLGTALVYFQSPRHHAEAKELFDKILERDGTSTPALIGVGLIYEEEEEYENAIGFFDRALKRDPSNIRVKSEAAWVKALKGDWKAAQGDLTECISVLSSQKTQDKDLLADAQYRLGTCLWNLDTSKQARRQRKGECAYAYWLYALNNNLNHAPTYTSLGIFYGDCAKDKKRARRCFQKALELSAAEVLAAERLSRSFADDGDWDRVELVAQRVVDSGKVKPPPGSKRKGISWPFAALGVAELNKLEYHKAIVSFQGALRIAPEDYHSWVGLGESYHNSGRYIAATKAILNAQKLEESNQQISADTWFTKYMLANIRRELGEYDEAIESYKAVIETHPNEEGVIIALMQTMVENSLSSVDRGEFGKAALLATDAIQYATTTPDTIRQTFNFWRTVADACSALSSVQSHVTDFPAESLSTLFDNSDKEGFSLLSNIDNVTADVVQAKGIFPQNETLGVDLTRILHATILCHKQSIYVASNDLNAQSVAHYNLGWAEYRAHTCLPTTLRKKASSYSKAAVRAFKRAIELEAGNPDFWNALGVVTSEINAQVAQHAFVRSLHINERSPAAWCNLGALALLSGDTKLANEAFTRAQSTDPDYAHAWLGQGLVALLHGQVSEARGLFTHAIEISEASSLPSRRQYSASMFDHVLVSPTNIAVASLLQPLFALNQLQDLRPQDLASGHLASLFLERTRDGSRAVSTLEKICDILEADFEQTESQDSLSKFTLGKTDLARAYLAAGSYDQAIECGETALGLSSEEQEGELSSEQRKKARLSAHLTLGLAQYYRKEYDQAEGSFESALEESGGNPDATCLLAQVLWAQGTDDSKEKARTALFEVIESYPEHVQSVLLLGVIALLDQDEGSLEAVVEELQGLRTKEKVSVLEQSQIGEVLRAIAGHGEGKTSQDMISQIQTDIMLHPSLPHGWSSLAVTAGDDYAAQMALNVGRRGIPPRGQLDAIDLAKTYAGTRRVGDAQIATFLAPWAKDGWQSLTEATKELQ